MDIDINIFGSHLKIEKKRHLLALGHQTLESRHDGLGEIGMLHVTAIDKEILMGTLLAS